MLLPLTYKADKKEVNYPIGLFIRIADTIYHKFREATDVQRSIYTNYAITTNDAYYKVRDAMFYKNLPYTILGRYKQNKFSDALSVNMAWKMPLILEKSALKLFCINDGVQTTDSARKQYRLIMEEMFSDKSSFEK